MNKYVLVIDEYKTIKYHPFKSDLDIETIVDELSELNSIAISEQSSEFSYLNVKLRTMYSRYIEEAYSIYTLDDWFKEYCIN